MYDKSYLKSISYSLVTINLEEAPLNLNKINFSSFSTLRSTFFNFINRYLKMIWSK